MIKKFIRRVFRLGPRGGPEVIPVAKHGIRREGISRGAQRTCETLQQAGHQAYVVGGAVRDLMLGAKPKDFDVATDATPDQVHRLFRRSRLIGRRFKIVHVLFGDETIEVSTFRAQTTAEAPADDASDEEQAPAPRSRAALRDKDHAVDEHGRVLRDNVFGTREQDAARRDFTLNALYYDPTTENVLDFHRGMRDVARKSVRMIGDPAARYREDPIRMLRAVRFAAKLGFSIEAGTRAPIRELAPLIGNVPPSRLFEEMQKLLMSGHAVQAVKRLRAEGLQHGLLPLLDVILEQPLGERFVMGALAQTDERVQQGKRVSPAFLFAALLWHEVLAAAKAEEKRGATPLAAIHAAMDSVIAVQTSKIAIPRRFTAMMKEIWILQPRFEQRSGRRPFSLLANERFRAGFDFMVLRAASGEVPNELAQWWETFQVANADEQQAMLVAPQAGDPAKRKRRRRRRKPGGPDGGAAGSPDAGGD